MAKNEEEEFMDTQVDNSFDVEVEWMRLSSPRGMRGRRRGRGGSASRRRRGALMAGDVEHMVVDADWAPHGGYQQEYGNMLNDMQVNEEKYDPSLSPSGMFVRKRERTQNWSLQEKLLLFRLVAPRLDVLENRRIDAMSSARKGRAWREIHELFSARYGPERDVFRIREQWRRMKQAAKADVAGKNPHKSSQSPAAAAVAAAVAAATSQVHMPPSPVLAQSLMMPPTAANLAVQQQQQAVLQQQQAAVAAAAAAATATTRNQMNSVLSDMIVKALEKVREREQEGGGPFDLSELDDGMGLGGFFSSGIAGMIGGNQAESATGSQNNSQVDEGMIGGLQGALSDNNPSGSATSSGGSNDAWKLTIVPSSCQQQATNSSDNAANSQSGGDGERLLTENKTLLTMGPKKVSHKPKASRKLLTIKQKKEIISAHEKGVRIVDLAAEYGIASSSIATILKMKEEIKAASVATGVKTFASQRSCINEEMEKLLMVWINERWMSGDIMTQEMIQSKARMIYADLKRNVVPSKGLEEEFKGSRGWLEKFKKRSGIHIRNVEEYRANKEKMAEKFSREFQEWIILNEYKPEQVFNCDETRLFWKNLPKRMVIAQGEKPGSKSIKDRITLLFCANASGDLKIKPMIVHHSERNLKKENVCKPMLGVYCKSNTHAWVSGSLFTEWITEVFGPSVRKYLREKGLAERVLLLLDNAPGHQSDLLVGMKFNFIEIKYLPPNSTSILQPMDQKVTSTFKKLYMKNMLQICFDATSSTSLTLKDFWKDHYHILHAIQAIAVAWDELSIRTLNAAWKKLWPHCWQSRITSVQDDQMTSVELAAENKEIVHKIISLSRALDFKVSEEDVEELIAEHSRDLTTEELEELKKQVDQEKKDCSAESEGFELSYGMTKTSLEELQMQVKQEREDSPSQNEEDMENSVAGGFEEMREQVENQEDNDEYLSEIEGDLEEISKSSLREELKKLVKREREDTDFLSEKVERMPTDDIQKMLHHWEEFQSLAIKLHPNKDEMERVCTLVEDSCLSYFKNILNKRKVS